MRIPLPAPLFDSLLALQTKRRWADDVTRREEAVCLFAGMGNPLYLTRDGHILAGPGWPDDPPETRPATDDESVAALVIGARQYDCPALLTFLPPRPAEGDTCGQCTGNRWFSLTSADGKPFEIICPGCAGRGWTVPPG